jgi:hypothetical protein
MIAWIAILITLTTPFVFVILRRAVAALFDLRRSPTHDDDDAAAEASPSFVVLLEKNLKAPRDDHDPLKAVVEVLKHTAEGQVALDDEAPDMWPSIRNSLRTAWGAAGEVFGSFRQFLAILLPLFFFLALFVGGTYVGIVCADMVGGTVVISTSSNAGDWVTDRQSAEYMLGGLAVMSENRQRRVWEYKRACYSGNGLDERCRIYYKRFIPSKPVANVTCPFDGEVCLYGKQGAYKRTTGLLDSNILGINAAPSKRPHFRKTMVCSPLRTDGNRVVSKGEPKYPNEYLYNYGPLVVRGEWINESTYSNPMEWKLDFEDNTPYTLS